MSIDARVASIVVRRNGSGHLNLIARPPNRHGDVPGIAGQRRLHFESSPADVGVLLGRNVWGGANELMLGDRKIAQRLSYTHILFVVNAIEGAHR